MKPISLLAVFAALLVASCSHPGRDDTVEFMNFSQTGTASYYDHSFAGNETASGVPYQPARYTAAHRFLPFGTRVKVVNPENDREVTVTINDRGPFVDGRIIDLSAAAFQRIAPLGAGTVGVAIEVVPAPE